MPRSQQSAAGRILEFFREESLEVANTVFDMVRDTLRNRNQKSQKAKARTAAAPEPPTTPAPATRARKPRKVRKARKRKPNGAEAAAPVEFDSYGNPEGEQV
jgi:hypothetical protein